MPAFFGRDLVLDVERGDPRLLVFADRADHVDCVAVAGIGIGDDRDADRLDRQPDKADILGQGQQAEIGVPVRPRTIRRTSGPHRGASIRPSGGSKSGLGRPWSGSPSHRASTREHRPA